MRICLFDIDGTLISSGGAGKTALESALEAEFGISEIDGKLQLSGRTDYAITTDLLRFAGLDDTPETRERLVRTYFEHLPDSLANSTGAILPGILELLELLHQREDVVLGLLTGNLREGARVKLSHFGLYEFFTLGGFGDYHHDRDDVARAALDAVRENHGDSIATEHIWVIGDTPLDIRCARAIGARVAAVCTGWHTRTELAMHGPDLLFDDLEDATEFTRELF